MTVALQLSMSLPEPVRAIPAPARLLQCLQRNQAPMDEA